MAPSRPEVTAYIDAAPSDRREALRAVRKLCHEELRGFVEEMAHGMPSYRRRGEGGELEFAFASQKRYVSLYVVRTDVMASHAGRLAGVNHGKGCIRYRHADAIDLGLLRSLLRATAASRGPVC
jgi:uncharacterized protein YdhG (YjbR/CyaY superfamily)